MIDEIAKAREKVIAQNMNAVLIQINLINERVQRQEGLITNLYQQIMELQTKYNLLLTKNFHGGSTEENADNG